MDRKVWKFGCRWDDTGIPQASIADSVFKRYNIVFAYTHAVLDMQKGDLIVLADGNTIIALGEALTPPAEISKLNIQAVSLNDQEKYFNRVNVIGCSVNYYWLDADQQFEYSKQGRFIHAVQIESHVNELFRKMQANNSVITA